MRSARPGASLSSLVLGVALLACGGDPPPHRYQQVVLVTIDTLRADHLPTYGYPRPTAPFLQELAAKGVVFRDAMSAASHTAPSHATILTGLDPHRHGVLRNGARLEPENPLLARAFSRAGYETAAFTSAGFLGRLAAGFDHVDARGRRAEATVDAALDWMRGWRRGPSLFTWIHLMDVHEWERVETPDPDALRAIRVGVPAGEGWIQWIAALHGFDPDGPRTGFRHAFWEDRARIVESIDRYDAQIRTVDDELRRLFDAVDALEGDSLWIVTADHGEGLGSHGLKGHGEHLYQAQLHVPLILYGSDEALPANEVAAPVHHVDLRPTLTQLAGIRDDAGPRAPAARSLVPAMRGARLDPQRLLIAQRRPVFDDRPEWVQEDVVVLRQGRHKYIFHSRSPDELYDLERDPLEQVEAPAGPDDPVRRRLELAAGAMAANVASRPAPRVPEELVSELRALGYMR